MFKSKAEFAIAMAQGRKFKNEQGLIFEFDDTKYYPFLLDGNHIGDAWNCYNTVEEVFDPQWYHNIPDRGVLCWVSYEKDQFDKTQTPEIIVLYEEDEEGYGGEPFHSEHDSWPYALPLTKAEVLRYVPE